VAPLKDTEMLFFRVYQDGHWALLEVSGVKKTIRHYAPVGLGSADLINMATICLKTEFEIEFETEGSPVDKRFPPQGNPGALMTAIAA
jgi:hypothetical protein